MLTPRRSSGFTLVEVLVAMVVMAILAALATAAFEGPLRKTRRTQAIVALAQAQMNQEVWRTHQAEFDPTRELVALRSSRAGDFYVFSGDTPSSGKAASAYRFAADARSGSSQAGDKGCQYLGIVVIDGRVQRLAGPDAKSAGAGAAADSCWGRS